MTSITSAEFRAGKGKQTEDQLQASCINWFKVKHPKLWEAKRLFSIPNGANKSPAARALFKKTGLQSGVCDLFLAIPKGDYAGLFIEMKAKNMALSEEQEKFIKAHESDYCCQVCWTRSEFETAVTNYLNQ